MIKPLLVKILNGTLEPATRLAEAALRRWRGLTPGEPVRMTPTNLAWDDFLRRRDREHSRNFALLHAPGKPGLVSIVLPVHNGERYLAEALDSILAQTYRDFELILVDDGSTDRTPEICAAYARRDGSIRLIRQHNARLPGALNAGFRAARGEFLTWTSDDNRLRPDFLEKMVHTLQADPATDMIFANYDLIGENGELLSGSEVCDRLQVPPASGHVHLLHDLSILNLINGNYIGGAFLYRRRVMHLVGEYSPHRFTCEDYDFWQRVNGQMRLRHAPFDDIVYEYRIHGRSLTARKDDLAIDRKTEALMAFDDFRRDFVSHPIAWMLRFDTASSAPSATLARRLAQRIRRAGHLTLDPGQWRREDLPRHFFPAAFLNVTDDLSHAVNGFPEELDLPEGVLRILIYSGSQTLPARVARQWDLCLAVSRTLAPRALEHPRQGWLVTADLDALWAALLARIQGDAAARIEALAARTASEPAPLRASLIICTNRPPRTLEAAIRAALNQTISPDEFEVIVVDNTPEGTVPSWTVPVSSTVSTSSSSPIPQSAIRNPQSPDSSPPHSHAPRFVRCPMRGLSIARNAGLAEARGEIVVFLDDDAIAAPDLLEKLLAAYARHPECGAIGGSILLKEHMEVVSQSAPAPPKWFAPAARKYWSHFEPPYEAFTIVEDWRQFPWGANWSARRAALLAVGGFRCRYGRGGRQFNTGEDVIAGLMIQRLGCKIGIEPAARVVHDVDPSRYTLRVLARTIADAWTLTIPLELDFYLPRPAHWPRLLWMSVMHLRHAAYAIKKDRFEGIENVLQAWGLTRAALKQVRLELHRWRVPRQIQGEKRRDKQ